MKFKSMIFAVAGLMAISAEVEAATLANWTFETSVPATAGPFAAEAGEVAASSFASGSTGGTYSNPAGTAPTPGESYSSNGWDVNDYYQFTTVTTGFMGITVAFDVLGSNTGPRDFALSYSVNGSAFTSAGTYTVANAFATKSFDLSAITDLDNADLVTFRLVDTSAVAVNGGAVAVTGTSRVDNVTIAATAVPEPSAAALLGGLGALTFLRRRRI